MHKNPLRCRSRVPSPRRLRPVHLHTRLSRRNGSAPKGLHEPQRDVGQRLRGSSSTLPVRHEGRTVQQCQELTHSHWLLWRVQGTAGKWKIPMRLTTFRRIRERKSRAGNSPFSMRTLCRDDYRWLQLMFENFLSNLIYFTFKREQLEKLLSLRF